MRSPTYPFRRLSILAALIPLTLASGGQARGGGLSPAGITYLPHWVPQAQFAGFYVAEDQGFYESAGLDVTILRGGPETPAGEWLAEGKADFSTMFLSQGLLARDRGAPVVNVAQLLHRSSLLLVAHSDSGIDDPHDLDGKKVGVWNEFRAQPMALFRQLDIEPIVVEQGASMGLFQWRGADAVCAMRYNEYHRLYLAGFNEDEISVIALDDYGVGFPEDGIYTLETTLKERPEAAAAFVEASLEGWRHAFAHPEEALDSVMRRIEEAGIASNRAHQRLMLQTLRDLYLNEDGTMRSPHLPEHDFDLVAEILMEFGELREKPDYERFHQRIAR